MSVKEVNQIWICIWKIWPNLSSTWILYLLHFQTIFLLVFPY